ncbi:MAG: flagellar assembly protein FliW [Myxococcales bacterium]|nr:flagellar assembly protein FliW [Myxococcales bacterium]
MPSEREFVLLRHAEKSVVMWLQSTTAPGFALPVVAAHQLDPAVSEFPVGELAARAGLPDQHDEIAVLVVTSFGSASGPTVNPIAPIVIGTTSLKGAQVPYPRSGLGVREKLTLAETDAGAMSPAA